MRSLPTAALTLSDIAGVVAIMGLLLGPLVVYLRWLHRQVTSLQADLGAADVRTEALAGAAARGFASTVSVSTFEAGVIARLLEGRLDETSPERILATLSDLRQGVNRAWAETSVLSDDESARRSALRQIDALLGDENSTRVARLRREPGG